MKKIKFALFVAALAASAPALAEGGGFYLGGSLGKAESKEDACFLTPAGAAATTCDRKGEVAWAAFAGVMANKYFGVEGGYHNLGKIVEVANAATGDRAWVRSHIAELVGFAALPIRSTALYVKGGGYYAKSSQTGSFIPSETKSTNKQWTYGVGASWDVFRHAGVRAEWQRFNNVGGPEIGFRTDVDLMSLGAYFKF